MMRSIIAIMAFMSGVANAVIPDNFYERMEYEKTPRILDPSTLIEWYLGQYKTLSQTFNTPERMKAAVERWGEIPKELLDGSSQYVKSINSTKAQITPLEFDCELRVVALTSLFMEYFFYRPLGISPKEISKIEGPLSILHPLEISFISVLDPRVTLEDLSELGPVLRRTSIQISIAQTKDLLKTMSLLKELELGRPSDPPISIVLSGEKKSYQSWPLFEKWILLSYFAKNFATSEHKAAFVNMINRILLTRTPCSRLCAQLEKLRDLEPNDFLVFIKSLPGNPSESLKLETLLESLSRHVKIKIKNPA